MRSAERRKVNVLEMKCLRSLVGVSRMNRVSNEEVSRRAGIERELASRADQRVLRWFGHVERLDDYRMDRRELMYGISQSNSQLYGQLPDRGCTGTTVQLSNFLSLYGQLGVEG